MNATSNAAAAARSAPTTPPSARRRRAALAADYRDDVAGRTGGVMKRCTEANTCPKFFLGLSGTEFWQLQGSPVLTDAYGFADLVQPDNARIYYYSSTQHGGNGGTASINYAPTAGVYPLGTVTQHVDTFRACSSPSRTGSCATPRRPRARCRSSPTARWCGRARSSSRR